MEGGRKIGGTNMFIGFLEKIISIKLTQLTGDENLFVHCR